MLELKENEKTPANGITFTASSAKHVSEDGSISEYEFSCTEGTYDVYVHQVAYEGIYSRAAISINDQAPVRFIIYRMPPEPHWMQVTRVPLSEGSHILKFHQLPGMGYSGKFNYDKIKLCPTATTPTDWRWGVTQLYSEGARAEQKLRLSLKTPDEVLAYQKRVREEFIKMLGSIPEEKGDLKQQITGTIQREE